MSEIRVDKISGKTSANAVTVTGENGSTQTSLQQGLAKAWVNFTGVTTTAIRDSFNISSLADTDTGDTTVNINNDFANDDFACVMFTNANSGEGAGAFGNNFLGSLHARTTGSVGHTSYASSPIDAALNDIIFHGDLA